MLYPPDLQKWEGHVPRVPHEIAPMGTYRQRCVQFQESELRIKIQ